MNVKKLLKHSGTEHINEFTHEEMDLRYVPKSVQESLHGEAPQLKQLAKKVFRSDQHKMESL